MATPSRSVLLFGPSTLFASDLGEDKTLLGLTRERLKAERPDVEWTCAGSVLFATPGMTRRAVEAVAKNKPDLVVMRIPQLQFMSDFVVYRIRELAPALYQPSLRFAEWLKRRAGGGFDGAPGFRGWLFRLPRSLFVRTIGVAPLVRVETAVNLVKETIDALLREENLTVVYLMPTPTLPPNVAPAEAARRRDYFVREVAGHCEARRVPWVDPREVHEQARMVRNRSHDGMHTDLSNREFDAWLLTEAIVQAAEGETALDFSALTGSAGRKAGTGAT